MEAGVMERVWSLRKAGLWAPQRLPRVADPPRPRAHWDCLLQEMEWMAEDFAQERRWKIAAAKTLCVSVSRHVQREAARRLREESRRGAALRRLARHAASAVTQFWGNMWRVR
ncbi:E1A-binding protein p400-like [Lethenteron reissneri]|uniref:E1A-binding protein p400-like n=1 Tax=Lethenteron reissneri TaxID=7753 RepID=UPI002AB71856|nr:E1A-binding protein p400-like [Lethenteron reissneri]XP_061437393.1 E1A-binding protein p400-like [Lethenteron reissneri]